MSDVIFYKKRLISNESGLIVVTDKFVSIHETPCFHFCVPESAKGLMPFQKRQDESEVACARRLNILKQISKISSRIAFPTEEQALKHLRFLKSRQLNHMKRDMAFIEKFLDTDELDERAFYSLIPDSRELVHKYLAFE